MKLLLVILSVVTLVGASVLPDAAASVLVYSEPSFLANVAPGYYLEDFNTVDSVWYSGPVSFSGGGYSYDMSASHGVWGGLQNMTTDWQTDSLVITFTGASVTALGGEFFPTGNFGYDTSGTIKVTFSGGETATLTMTSARPFLGLLSTVPVASLSIDNNGSASWPTVDHFYAGAASNVPLPGAVWLLGSGLVGLAGLRRKFNR